MTKNPTIDYLRGAIRAGREADSLIDRIQRLRCRAEKITAVLSDLPPGAGGATREDIIVRLVDMQDELEARLAECERQTQAVELVIGAVANKRYRDLLRYRYLNGWTWERITEAMGRSDVSWTHTLHGRALLEVENLRYPMETNT